MADGFLPDLTPPGTMATPLAKPPASGSGKGKGLAVTAGAASAPVKAAPIHGSGVPVSSKGSAHLPLQTKKAHLSGRGAAKRPLQNQRRHFGGRR